MKSRKVLSVILAMSLLLALSGCGKKVKNCIGNISYSSTAVCMCYEEVPGEYSDDGSAVKGIVYRQVTDLDGIMKQKEMPVLLYFYTTANPTAAGITAGVEDLAERLSGKVVVVALDSSAYPTINTELGVMAVPEFVLMNGGSKVATFGSNSKTSWTILDVSSWLKDNGVG